MIRITKTQARPNMLIPFFAPTDDAVKTYFYNKFIKTKKFSPSSRMLSEDGLMLTSVSEWSSVEDYLDLLTDEYCHTNMLVTAKKYNTDNNIILKITVEEI